MCFGNRLYLTTQEHLDGGFFMTRSPTIFVCIVGSWIKSFSLNAVYAKMLWNMILTYSLDVAGNGVFGTKHCTSCLGFHVTKAFSRIISLHKAIFGVLIIKTQDHQKNASNHRSSACIDRDQGCPRANPSLQHLAK
jgi:hypothetical protein